MRTFSFDTHIFKEGETCVAYAPSHFDISSDISSCGVTGEEAKRTESVR
jgi:hypothetical protein